MDIIIIILLIVILLVVLNINHKIPKRDYVKEAVEQYLHRNMNANNSDKDNKNI